MYQQNLVNNSLIFIAPGYRKERGSIAHGNAINKDRRISGADPIHNRKHGKKMDCIYVAGAFELGCLEIGGLSNDQTKAYADGMLKLPIVLKDMMIDISTRSNASLNELVLVGYNISGNFPSSSLV